MINDKADPKKLITQYQGFINYNTERIKEEKEDREMIKKIYSKFYEDKDIKLSLEQLSQLIEKKIRDYERGIVYFKQKIKEAYAVNKNK